MQYDLPTNEHSASSATEIGGAGSLRNKLSPTSLLSKFLIVVGVTLTVAAVCGLALRISVTMISEQMPSVAKALTDDREQSRVSRLNGLKREHERIREEARQSDRGFLQRRRDQLWQEDSVRLPDKNDAYQRWYREVREIEEQLAEPEQIQASLSPEDAKRGPLAKGTVLWHRKQRLKELHADAPL